GTNTINNVVISILKDIRQTFTGTSLSGYTLSGDTIKWYFNNLQPLEKGEFDVRFSNLPPPTLNIGDTLNIIGKIDPLNNDITPANNNINLKIPVRGSFDPNEKTELHNGVFPLTALNTPEYLNYIIRFQNTGNDTAFRVIVRDTLSPNVIWNTIETISSSHQYTFSQKNNTQCEWLFNNISLSDSTTNEPMSHGYVAFRVKPKADLGVGDSIINTASIYFDFNEPVKTNSAFTEVKNFLITPVSDLPNPGFTANVFPNPSSGILWLSMKGKLKGRLLVKVFDLSGRLKIKRDLGNINLTSFSTSQNLSNLSSGIYLMTIEIDQKKLVFKIMVQ
ncbi:MAG: T9SS type A sorting domain-containing protein, partial [Bacteroidetes bacterium]|nr:T9SS type A sorting domain-containing protein [Bacteroidota bacterium]